MTTEQTRMMQFAARHDWGSTAIPVEGGIQVSVECGRRDGTWFTETSVVRSMSELRDWAGY